MSSRYAVAHRQPSHARFDRDFLTPADLLWRSGATGLPSVWNPSHPRAISGASQRVIVALYPPVS